MLIYKYIVIINTKLTQIAAPDQTVGGRDEGAVRARQRQNRQRTREPEPTTQPTATRETIETRRSRTRYTVRGLVLR